MTFEDAIEFVLKYEGGYVNDPDDPGGETNFGISKRAYPNLNIRILTLEEAIAIYRNDFWNPAKVSEMPPEIRLLVFDTAVNMGVGSTVRMLQLLLDLKQDGVPGEKTLGAIRTADLAKLARDFRVLRLKRYVRLKHFEKYGVGWVTRLLDVTHESAKGAA